MNDTLTVALAQVVGSGDPARNLEKARRFAHMACEKGAGLLVFPEMYMGLPSQDHPPVRFVREPSTDFVGELATIAANFQTAVVAGVWEPSPDPERVFNTAVFIDAQGRLKATYRKLHLFNAFAVRESDTMVPGDAPPPVVSLKGLRVGLALCYDLRFPELFRFLAEKGADLVLVPSAWYQGSMKEEHWLTLLRARAVENTYYTAGCNLIGKTFCGRSAVFDPFGVPVACATEDEDCLITLVSAERVRAVRAKLPSLRHRRKDLF